MNQLTVMGRLTKDPESPFNENAPAKFAWPSTGEDQT